MINIQKVKQYLKPGDRGVYVGSQIPEPDSDSFDSFSERIPNVRF